jgi:hypothetical protein
MRVKYRPSEAGRYSYLSKLARDLTRGLARSQVRELEGIPEANVGEVYAGLRGLLNSGVYNKGKTFVVESAKPETRMGRGMTIPVRRVA